MDLLDRLLGHDAWTTRQLLDRARELTDDALDREHDIAHRTVRRTFLHLIANMEVWADLMAGTPPDIGVNTRPENRTLDALARRLDAAAAKLSAVATPIARENRWDDTWLDTLDDPPTRKTYGGAIAHILTHSMHHRAQLLYLLRLSGLTNLPEGDVLTWENTAKAEGRL